MAFRNLIDWIRKNWNLLAILVITIIAVVLVTWFIFSRPLPTPPGPYT